MGLKESGLRGSIRNVSTGIGAAISIDTLEAENVEADSATIRGEITELTNFGEDAEVFFEFGEITEGLPNTTDIQLQDTVGVFTEDLTNLSEGTTHEFQAFGSVRDVSDDGVVLTFETDVAIPDSGADQEWLFDEGAGSTLNNNITSLDGDIVGADWSTSSGVDGNHLDFDGEPDRVQVDNSNDGQMHGDGGFAIAVWVNPDETWDGLENIVAKSEGGTTNPDDWGLFAMDDGIRIRVGGEGREEENFLPTNEWTLLFATYDGGNESRLWFNDADLETVFEAGSPSDNDRFSIGGPYDGSRRGCNGQIAVCQYWDEEKDSTFVSNYYDDWEVFFD